MISPEETYSPMRAVKKTKTWVTKVIDTYDSVMPTEFFGEFNYC